ncbi:hypothetical protein L0F63_004060 [Massospora cicadina]|nr:hypothetical protein L0F63_004060 [Massospora cicadina]
MKGEAVSNTGLKWIFSKLVGLYSALYLFIAKSPIGWEIELKDIDWYYSKCNGMEIRELTITGAHHLFKENQLTPLQLTKCYLERIKVMNPYLNAILETNPHALKIAEELSKELDPDFKKYPLWGIPILIKDNIATADDMNTTAGSFALLKSKPKRDARVITLLRKAGAIILGKTNMSDMGGTTYGSSSGSATSVAANLAIGSLGTETCGSIIAPASVSMVFGAKGTYGLTSNQGTIPLAPSIDTVGVMTRTLEDGFTLLNSIFESPMSCDFNSTTGLKNITVGVIRYPYLVGTPLEVVEQFNATVERVQRAGFQVVDPLNIDLEFLNYSDAVNVLDVEMKRFLGSYLETYTEGGDVKSLSEVIAFNKRHPFISGISRGFQQDLMEKANDITHDLNTNFYTKSLSKLKPGILTAIQAFMNRSNTHIMMIPSNNDWYPFAPASLGGLPIMSIPAGTTKDGVPFGVAFYGMPYFECQLFYILNRMERVGPPIRFPPKFHT